MSVINLEHAGRLLISTEESMTKAFEECGFDVFAMSLTDVPLLPINQNALNFIFEPLIKSEFVEFNGFSPLSDIMDVLKDGFFKTDVTSCVANDLSSAFKMVLPLSVSGFGKFGELEAPAVVVSMNIDKTMSSALIDLRDYTPLPVDYSIECYKNMLEFQKLYAKCLKRMFKVADDIYGD